MSRAAVAAAALLAAATLALAAGCASAPRAESLSADEEYRLGTDAYARGRWAEAAEHLDRLVLNYPEDRRTAEARYLLGQANFQLEEYPSAAQDFERFQADFPADSLADDALYWAGRAYEEQSLKPQLDQSDTRRAIASYGELLRQYPGSELAREAEERRAALRDRLAEKEFMNAQYYFRQELWAATEIYARHLIEEFPQSRYVAPAYLMLVRAYEAQGQSEEARRVRDTLLEQFPDSPEAGEVRRALTSSSGGPPARPE